MQEQQQPQKRGSFAWLYIIGLIIILFLIVQSMNSCGAKLQRLSYNQFTQDIGLDSTPLSSEQEYGFDSHRPTKPGAAGKDVFMFEDAVGFEIPDNKIEVIAQQGNNFYVLLKGFTDPKKRENFVADPDSHADYYFYYPQTYDISEIWNAYNSWVNGTLYTQQYIYLTDDAATDENDTVAGLGITEDTWETIKTTDEAGLTDPQVTELRAKISYIQFVENFKAAYPIIISPSPVPSSWFSFSNILSMLSLVVLLVVGYFIFRSFSNRGSLGNIGRNRASHTMGGDVHFSDVAGIDEEKEEVQEIVGFLKDPKKYLDLGARIPKGVLLVGQPGTGKTLLAKAIAGEAGVHFLSVSGSDFSEMLVGVGPSRMRDLFETAKMMAPAIIFIDEIDSIARMRGVGASGVSDENEQTLNQLLVQMDGFTKSEGVIVIAATNRPDVLDQALLRPGRFDRQIVVQLPDVKGREQILKVHAKGKPIGDDVDLKRVAQIISGFSGADIENLLNESAIIAAKKDKRKISMLDITEGINKVLLGPQKRSRIITDEDKKITAYHEAGHAIVSRLLQPDQVVTEVSIIPRGMAAGYTLTNEKDIESHHKSRKFLTTQLAMLMAGRVAEQIFIGDTCTGSSNDIKVATDLSERMVTMFGMSSKLGPLYYGKEEEIALRLYSAQNPHSEALQSVIDEEIKSLIVAAEKQASDVLTKNKSKVDIMAEVLLARETIYAADITLIMEGKDSKSVIAEMEKRDVQTKEQEKKEKTEAEIEILNRDLEHIMKHSKRFVEAKLAAPEKLVQLEANMELARGVVRSGGELTVLPTLDNLDDYATIIASKKEEVAAETKSKKSTAGEKKSAKKASETQDESK